MLFVIQLMLISLWTRKNMIRLTKLWLFFFWKRLMNQYSKNICVNFWDLIFLLNQINDDIRRCVYNFMFLNQEFESGVARWNFPVCNRLAWILVNILLLETRKWAINPYSFNFENILDDEELKERSSDKQILDMQFKGKTLKGFWCASLEMFPGFGRRKLGIFILFSAKYNGESRLIYFSSVMVSLSPQRKPANRGQQENITFWNKSRPGSRSKEVIEFC